MVSALEILPARCVAVRPKLVGCARTGPPSLLGAAVPTPDDDGPDSDGPALGCNNATFRHRPCIKDGVNIMFPNNLKCRA